MLLLSFALCTSRYSTVLRKPTNMHVTTLFTGLLAAATFTLASPVESGEAATSPVAAVFDALGKAYMLHDTQSKDMHVITNKTDGEYMHPVSYAVRRSHICKFYR